MIKISKLTDYAIVILVRLAQHDDVMTSPALAMASGIPEPTVAKVLKILSASELVKSQRGARGGYRATQRLADVSILQVIQAVDGPVAVVSCVDGGACKAQRSCQVYGSWDIVNNILRKELMAISLQDMLDWNRQKNGSDGAGVYDGVCECVTAERSFK